MVFKKDITPIGKKGEVTKHSGKGSAVRRPQLLPQLTGRYPSPPRQAPAAAPAPMGLPTMPFKEP